MAHGLHGRAGDVGNQVAVVVDVRHVARDAVVLQAQLPVVELVKVGDDRAQAAQRRALGQGHGGGQQHVAGGRGR